MVETIAQHTHCHICGKAIPLSELFCSEECKAKYASMMKKRKIFMLVLNILIGVIIIFLFLILK